MSKISDLTLPPDLYQKSGTGPVQTQKPIYYNSLPPCNHACPAGENIQKWLDLAQRGSFKEAWEALVENNPTPGIHGRVCYHPCETSCNRAFADDSVQIHAVERYLGDQAIQHGWAFPKVTKKTGKRVLIIGAGPSGLSAAYHLRRLGHEVEIKDNSVQAGGMMRFGIPAYRLPREILDKEIDRLIDMGIKLTLNVKVTDILDEKTKGKFDAVFMATGAHHASQVEIPGKGKQIIVDAISYLRNIAEGKIPHTGSHIIVYGGGNTAMDAARTAKRLGAEVSVVYRRDRKSMPAHDFEVVEAMEEGVSFHFLRTIVELKKDAIELEVMKLDKDNKPKPTQTFESIKADTIIMALGQNIDAEIFKKIDKIEIKNNVVTVNEQMMTGEAGIFAGGDMIPSERTVTIATGHGKKAAHHIDAWLSGKKYQKPQAPNLRPFEDLHLWYKTQADASVQPQVTPVVRAKNFNEVLGGLTTEEAIYEAMRCYSCGNCFECDGCFGACPEDAISKLGKGKGYEVNYDKCTGCRACFLQCPCHAIEMVARTDNAISGGKSC